MSGTISFLTYPAANRVPGVYAEIDPSGANNGTVQQRALLIGQVGPSPDPSVVLGVPALSTGGAAANLLFGYGSMLARMVNRYRALDTWGELWTLPLADAPASVAAAGTITLSGTATTAGTLAAYIGGVSVPVLVNSGDTAANVATNLAATIAAMPQLPVSASVAGAIVTLTAKNKGLMGNGIDIRFNYLGIPNGERIPVGLGVPVISAMTGGTLNPSATLITALAQVASDKLYDFVGCPYTDTASLNALQSFFNDSTGRWSWQQEAFGGFFACFQGTLAGCATFGTGRNDQHGSILGISGSPTPAEECAADVTAVCADSLRASPATPLQNLATNILAPAEPMLWDLGERNTLLYDGISTTKLAADGTVLLERMVTTYQENAAGAPDDSYLNVETMYTLAACIRQMRTYLTGLYPNKILVQDGNRVSPASNATTAKAILGSAITLYNAQAAANLVQNPDVFAKAASAQNAGGGRVSLYLPYQLADQLRIITMLIAFTQP